MMWRRRLPNEIGCDDNSMEVVDCGDDDVVAAALRRDKLRQLSGEISYGSSTEAVVWQWQFSDEIRFDDLAVVKFI